MATSRGGAAAATRICRRRRARRRRYLDRRSTSVPDVTNRAQSGLYMSNLRLALKRVLDAFEAKIAPAAARAVTKLHGAFKMHSLCARVAGVLLNISAKFWRISR